MQTKRISNSNDILNKCDLTDVNVPLADGTDIKLAITTPPPGFLVTTVLEIFIVTFSWLMLHLGQVSEELPSINKAPMVSDNHLTASLNSV